MKSKFKVLDHKLNNSVITMVKMQEGERVFTGHEYRSLTDDSKWRVVSQLLTPSKLIAIGVRNIEVVRVSTFGTLNSGDLLEIDI
jgi:hypothetical protein